MAPQKKRPLTTGKGTKSQPIATPGRSPRRVSSKPSEASKVRAAKKTTSSGITRTPSGRKQSEGRAGRQAISKAKVTSASDRGPSPGRYGQNKQRPGGLTNSGGQGRVTGTAGRPKPATPAKVTTGKGKDALDKAQARGKAEVRKAVARRGAVAASRRMARKLAVAGAKRVAGAAGKLAGKAGLFYEGIKANNTATGTLEEARKKYGEKAIRKEPTKKVSPKKPLSAGAKSFDKAFASARSAGKKEFTWRGKKYTTKMK